MERNRILYTILGILFICSCTLDNYEKPDTVLKGKILDKKTGNNIQTRQPDGIQIRLLEQSYENPVPFNFWAKRDGSFKNTRIFSAKYKVFPINGPFEQSSVKEKVVDLTHDQVITFKVEPYARITNVNIKKSGSNGIQATYKITPTKNNRKILNSRLIAYTSPKLHQNTTNKLSSSENNLKDISNEDIGNMSFTDKISNLKQEQVYFARIMVLTDNSLSRYNYSAVVKIEF